MAVLDSMAEEVVESKNNGHNQNQTLENLNCRFDYPLPINDIGASLKVPEYVLEYFEDLPTFRYKLKMIFYVIICRLTLTCNN